LLNVFYTLLIEKMSEFCWRSGREAHDLPLTQWSSWTSGWPAWCTVGGQMHRLIAARAGTYS